MQRLGGAVAVFAACELLMVAAIFVFAYPMERWVNKPHFSAGQSALSYLLLGFVTFLISAVFFILTIDNYEAFGYLPTYVLAGTVLGTYTASVGRLIYVSLPKFERITQRLSIAIYLLMAIGIVILTQNLLLV